MTYSPFKKKGVTVIETDNVDLTVYNLTEQGGYLLSDMQCEKLTSLSGISSMQTAEIKLNLITLSVPKFLIVRDADKIPENTSFLVPVVGAKSRKDRKLTMDMSTDKIQEIVKQVLSRWMVQQHLQHLTAPSPKPPEQQCLQNWKTTKSKNYPFPKSVMTKSWLK